MKSLLIFSSGVAAGAVGLVASFIYVKPIRHKIVNSFVTFSMHVIKTDPKAQEFALKAAHEIIKDFEGKR